MCCIQQKSTHRKPPLEIKHKIEPIAWHWAVKPVDSRRQPLGRAQHVAQQTMFTCALLLPTRSGLPCAPLLPPPEEFLRSGWAGPEPTFGDAAMVSPYHQPPPSRVLRRSSSPTSSVTPSLWTHTSPGRCTQSVPSSASAGARALVRRRRRRTRLSTGCRTCPRGLGRMHRGPAVWLEVVSDSPHV